MCIRYWQGGAALLLSIIGVYIEDEPFCLLARDARCNQVLVIIIINCAALMLYT